MSKGGGGSAPAPPDPAKTAAAQAGASKEAVRESALVNQISEVTPYGELHYTGAIGAPDRTRTTTLSPSGQTQLDQRNQVAEALGNKAIEWAGYLPSDQFSLDFLGEAPTSASFSGDMQDLEQATYDRAYNLMSPELQRQEKAMEVQLAQRGIPIGSDAWNDTMSSYTANRDRSLNDLSLGSVGAGRAEHSRLFSLDQATRAQGINEAMLERAQPFNEMSAFLQGAPVMGSPQFAPATQYNVPAPDVMGATYGSHNAAMNAWQANQSNQGSAMGGLFSLGSAVIGAPWW